MSDIEGANKAKNVFDREGKVFLIQKAREVLRKIIIEKANPREMDNMLIEAGVTSEMDIEYLETPHRELDGVSPFAFLRSEIEAEKKRV